LVKKYIYECITELFFPFNVHSYYYITVMIDAESQRRDKKVRNPRKKEKSKGEENFCKLFKRM